MLYSRISKRCYRKDRRSSRRPIRRLRQLAQHGFQKITDKQPAADLFGITIADGADELRVGIFTQPHREIAVDRVNCWGFEKRRGRN